MSGEANSSAYLTQRLLVAVQRGNAASMLGTVKVDSENAEFFLYKYCFDVFKIINNNNNNNNNNNETPVIPEMSWSLHD